MGFDVKFSGTDELLAELKRLKNIDAEGIANDSATQMYNRSKTADPKSGGTPVDTTELRQSSGKSGRGSESEMGYVKEYAPHVELGHRTVGGGYVDGQYFLKENVERQSKIFNRDLKKALTKKG